MLYKDIPSNAVSQEKPKPIRYKPEERYNRTREQNRIEFSRKHPVILKEAKELEKEYPVRNEPKYKITVIDTISNNASRKEEELYITRSRGNALQAKKTITEKGAVIVFFPTFTVISERRCNLATKTPFVVAVDSRKECSVDNCQTRFKSSSNFSMRNRYSKCFAHMNHQERRFWGKDKKQADLQQKKELQIKLGFARDKRNRAAVKAKPYNPMPDYFKEWTTSSKLQQASCIAPDQSASRQVWPCNPPNPGGALA